MKFLILFFKVCSSPSLPNLGKILPLQLLKSQTWKPSFIPFFSSSLSANFQQAPFVLLPNIQFDSVFAPSAPPTWAKLPLSLT